MKRVWHIKNLPPWLLKMHIRTCFEPLQPIRKAIIDFFIHGEFYVLFHRHRHKNVWWQRVYLQLNDYCWQLSHIRRKPTIWLGVKLGLWMLNHRFIKFFG